MKKNILTVLLIIETVILLLVLLLTFLDRSKESKNSWDYYEALLSTGDYRIQIMLSDEEELFRDISPDGVYSLLITRIADPDFPFGDDHLKITLFEVIPQDEAPRVYYRASFMADVANDGAHAAFEVEWLEDSVQITLMGSEQPTAYYILPFKTLDD